MSTIFTSDLHSVQRFLQGKVRDIYAVDDAHLLIVATDRLSAFDVVLPTPIPDKGRILTAMSNFWFARTTALVPNHLTTRRLEDVLTHEEVAQVHDRAVIVRRIAPLPVEAIVRGYIAGSAWAEYQQQGTLCGVQLPTGLRESERLPEPMFTPSTKAPAGDHDLNISFEDMVSLLGGRRRLAEHVRDTSLRVYHESLEYALRRGIIIADTKFEFGLLDDQLYLIDEVLTPDSSRFWPLEEYTPGHGQPSFDKQGVRDYLTGTGWNKRPPAPALPSPVVAQTTRKYQEALRLLTGTA
jgi:phosphoribosylaminoimidazole-succinocarboxamide synthase